MNNSIDNLLQYYSSTERYQAKQNQIPNDAIAFVEDEGVIYTHGHKFGGSADIENGSVTTSKIAQKAVTSSKLADNIQIKSLQAENITIQNDDEEIILISGGTEPITSKYGFKKEGKTNADVLLAGGGTKPLSEIGGGGVEQIQSDWNQTNENAKDYIKNKPTIPQVPEIDYEPTPNSDNLVTSGGVYNAINEIDNIETGSITDTSTYERTTYSGIVYHWCIDKVFQLNTGDSVIVTPRHVLASQTVWASDPIALIPVETGSYKYTAAADNMRITVGFTSADEFDYVITRKNSILDYVSRSTVSCIGRQTLSFEEQELARENIGAGSDREWKQSVSDLAGNVYDKAHSYSKDSIDNRFNSLDIPEKISDLPNDANYLTEHQDISGKADANNVYTKEEVAAMLSRTPENDVVVVSELPSASVPDTSIYENKLYRLVGTTSYSEWGWNGAAFVKLAEYDHGIDDEPDPESDNLISSKGVADAYGSYIEDNDYIKVTTDKNDYIVNGIKENGFNYLPKVETDTIKTKVDITVSENIPGWKKIIVDSDENIIGGLTEKGEWYFPRLITNDNKYKGAPLQSIPLRGITVFDRATEWVGIDGYSYRIQGGYIDSASGWIFICGNRIVNGVQDNINAMICVTKDLRTFEGALYYYGEYGHANDVTYNPSTGKLYVAAGSGNHNDTLGAKLCEFTFNKVDGTLTFDRYIDFPDIAENGKDVLNVEYINDKNCYIVGDYDYGNIYDANFDLVEEKVFYWPESVIDKIFSISAAETNAQSIFYYDGYLYKVFSVTQESSRRNLGALLRYTMDGNIDGINIVNTPNITGFELEFYTIDKIHRKVYAGYDGERVGFMEGYLDNTVQLPPRNIANGENLDNIRAVGTYTVQNSTVARSLINWPSEYLIPEGGEEPEYHGGTIEIKNCGIGGIIQYVYTFISDNLEGNKCITIMRINLEGVWYAWKQINN